MNVFIERLKLPIDEGWNQFITPLQQAYLSRVSFSTEFQEGKILAWGVTARQPSAKGVDTKCGILIVKIIKSLSTDEEQSLLLSVISIAFGGLKVSKILGPMLLRHLFNFASEHGFSGVHIGCPKKGQYGDFVRELTASVGSWILRPGKVIVRLSDIQRVGPVLTRLEKAVKRKQNSADWQIEPYELNDLRHWKDRIAFSTENHFGVPWDSDDQSYDWEPSLQYSRVLKSNNLIIGWLICHFISEDVLRYGKLWVDPGWEKSGAPLALLCEVIRSAHFQSNSKNSIDCNVGFPVPAGCFISHPFNGNLHRFVTNKFKPVCDSWAEILNYYCYLG